MKTEHIVIIVIIIIVIALIYRDTYKQSEHARGSLSSYSTVNNCNLVKNQKSKRCSCKLKANKYLKHCNCALKENKNLKHCKALKLKSL